MARTYKKRLRADQEADTRQRIVEATVTLHAEIGGPQTSVKAIAERAGVERATVYRHFPDEHALLSACTGHYLQQNPPPDPGIWAAIHDARARLGVALPAIYAYHRQTEVMSARAAIDVPQMPTLREVLAPMFAYWDGVRNVLASGWTGDTATARQLRAAIGHACAFSSWQSLVRGQNLSDMEAAALMVRWICCLADGSDASEENRLKK